MHPSRTLFAPLATGLAIVTIAAPAAAIPVQPRPLPWTPPRQDMRHPDTRDAAEGRTTRTPATNVVRDRRSPDARDAARGVSTASVSAPVIEVTGPVGFDWGDAAIGAGGAAGVLAISLAGALTVRRRQRGTRSRTALG